MPPHDYLDRLARERRATLSPRERADKVRAHIEALGVSHPARTVAARPDALLPPGSLVLTAQEAKQVRTALDWASCRSVADEFPAMADWASVALALLSPDVEKTA